MISLMTFIIYNSLFAFAMLPTAKQKPTSLIVTNTNDKSSTKTLTDVFMHMFVKQHEDIDFNKYMPHIKEISNKYDNIKYNLIVIVNDTTSLGGWLSAEENNEIAMNSLWKDPKIEAPKSNIGIQYTTLSVYMENSPLKKYWKTLPQHLIEFLARSVSIWDKGGIAFDPDILTPRTENTIYKEKLHILLKKCADKSDSEIKTNKPLKMTKTERKLNNIRDIINALEHGNEDVNAFSQQTLAEAENIKTSILSRNQRHLATATEAPLKKEFEKNTEPYVYTQSHLRVNSSSDGNTKETRDRFEVNNTTDSVFAIDTNQNITKFSLLPLFLEFIFHNKLQEKQSPTEADNTNRTRRRVIEVPSTEDVKSSLSTHSLDEVEKKVADAYKPVIISAAGIYNKSEHSESLTENPSKNERLEKNRLTIDLRGKIIATDTACHAFLGTIFSNAVHHSEEESVTDFIIAELTIFCKGLLSSCMGIDLILL